MSVRRLVWVKALHGSADLGSLEADVRQRFGPGRWTDHEELIAAYWGQVRDEIEALAADLRGVRIYHDSIPVACADSEQLVRDLAGRGSRDFQLVLELLQRGAMLVGTEDPALLSLEYQMCRGRPTPPRERWAAVLAMRDRFIMERIDATLPPGATGILFLGAAHDVRPFAPPDMEIECIPGDPAATAVGDGAG